MMMAMMVMMMMKMVMIVMMSVTMILTSLATGVRYLKGEYMLGTAATGAIPTISRT